MTRGTRWLGIILLFGVMAAGCKSSSSAAAAITVLPTLPTVLVNGMIQFEATAPNATGSVTWSVNGVSGGNTTVGTIDVNGLYTAPALLPGTTITVTATQGNVSGSTTVTLDSGVRLSVTPGTATVGTGENFAFSAVVTGVPANASISGTCNNITNTPVPCTAVTWTVTSTTGGTIGSTTGIYKAGGTAGTDTVTATSVYDTTKTATSTVTTAAAAAPAITSVSPNIGPVGALFQDIYLTGTNFFSTTSVFINGMQVPGANVALGSFTSLLVRVPDSSLTAAATLTFTVAQQGGGQQSCATLANCQVVLSPVRPAIISTSPDSISLPSGGSAPFLQVNGGYFGTTNNPTVATQFAGLSPATTVNNARQLTMTINGADAGAPGLYPVAVLQAGNQGPGAPRAVTNLAVQPIYSSPPSVPTQSCNAPAPIPCTLTVGGNPAAVAINAATGLAVIANKGSNDITLIDLTAGIPVVVATSICTGSVGAVSAPCPGTATAPLSVAVDDLRNIALVANSGTNTLSVVDLSAHAVTAIIASGPTGISGVPKAVGINPVSGRAIVAYQSSGYASIVDLTQSPPVVTGVVDLSTGPVPRIAVSDKLNWAIVTPGSTPGGIGSLSIVDLGQQTAVSIASPANSGAACVSGTVTITTTASHGLQQNQSVLVTGIADPSFAGGVFTVLSVPSSTTFTYSQACVSGHATSGGGTISFAVPVATLAVDGSVTGVALNSETDKAILVGTSQTAQSPTILNVLDQTSTLVPNVPPTDMVGILAAAFNPLTNIAVTVNPTTGHAMLIDPSAPTVLSQPFGAFNNPVDVAIDPGTDNAVIVNQGNNTVGIISLGALRPLQVVEVAHGTTSATFGLPQVTVGSTLASGVGAAGSPPVNNVTLTIIGKGFSLGTPQVRLDASPLTTTVVSDRRLTAVVPTSMQTGPRRYALDVFNGSAVSNAAPFTVIQSVDVTSTCASAPTPQGVAIDPQRNIAVVTNSGTGCNNVSLINLATGTGQTVAVGTQPVGVDILPSAGLAVVTNYSSNNASIVDEVGGTVVATVTSDLNPSGVAIDPLLRVAAVAATNANVIDTFPVSAASTASTSIAGLQGPGAVAVDPTRHLVGVANLTGNTLSLIDLNQINPAITVSLCSPSCLPEAVTFDPVSSSFLVALSLNNAVSILNLVSQTASALRVGVNPTSIAYNFATGTLVTGNNASHTMTVVDFPNQRVRAVLPVSTSTVFGVAIHPFTNLAVVADAPNSRVLFLPLPR